MIQTALLIFVLFLLLPSQVMKTPRLLSTIIDEFLTPQDRPGPDAYGKAQPKAIKLLRVC